MTRIYFILTAIRSAVLVLTLTAVTVVFTGKTANAVTITPAQPGADILFDAVDTYTVNSVFGITTLKNTNFSVTLAPRGGSAPFLATLVAAFGAGWNFFAAGADLTGSFNIDTYDAVGTSTRVGANFDMNYVTGAADVVDFTGSRQYHWIQRVTNYHAITGGHGVLDDKIDTSTFTPPADTIVPFYDGFSAAEVAAGKTFPTSPPRFQDGPGRSDPDRNHSWKAEVYLVEELLIVAGVRQVQIYNGVNWGWDNNIPDVVPLPPAILLYAIGISGLALLRRRRRTA